MSDPTLAADLARLQALALEDAAANLLYRRVKKRHLTIHGVRGVNREGSLCEVCRTKYRGAIFSWSQPKKSGYLAHIKSASHVAAFHGVDLGALRRYYPLFVLTDRALELLREEES